MNLKGSKTETNLQTAFMQECQARSRNTLFSETARREGYEQIAAIFNETAENERAHALISQCWVQDAFYVVRDSRGAMRPVSPFGRPTRTERPSACCA